MAGAFPTLSFGQTVKYPLKLKVTCTTRVREADNSTSQRYASAKPKADIEATYNDLKDADRVSIDNFFDSQKGMFDSTWTLSFDSKTFTEMRFMEDAIEWEESKPNRWSTRLLSRGFYPAISSPSSTLPVLSTGAITQLPWSKERKFETIYVDLDDGTRHALAMRGGGFTNYPTTAERNWNIKCPAVTSAEAEEFIKFFISKHGQLGSFTFTDPDTSVVYSACHFGSDDMEAQHLGPNQTSLSFSLVKS